MGGDDERKEHEPLVVHAPTWKSPKKRKFKLPPPPVIETDLGKDRFYSVPVVGSDGKDEGKKNGGGKDKRLGVAAG